jgi:DNA-binding NarL/FixJ family response regulator
MEAIRKVMGGERYLAPSLPATLLEANSHDGALPLEALSPREQEIFALVARGFSSEAIGAELRISVKTVETHRAHINRKLGLHSTAEIIRFAARHGLLTD